ncbi:MAG: ATP-binding protein [Actinomycetota bacterium]
MSVLATGNDWRVRLEVPADTRHLHIVRLTAAGAAAEAGLNADEVEDVKIAVDELCSIIIAGSDGGDQIGLTFEARDRSLVVEANAPAAGALEVDELARAILDATVDELVLGAEAAGGFRLTKHGRDD